MPKVNKNRANEINTQICHSYARNRLRSFKSEISRILHKLFFRMCVELAKACVTVSRFNMLMVFVSFIYASIWYRVFGVLLFGLRIGRVDRSYLVTDAFVCVLLYYTFTFADVPWLAIYLISSYLFIVCFFIQLPFFIRILFLLTSVDAIFLYMYLFSLFFPFLRQSCPESSHWYCSQTFLFCTL